MLSDVLESHISAKDASMVMMKKMCNITVVKVLNLFIIELLLQMSYFNRKYVSRV